MVLPVEPAEPAGPSEPSPAPAGRKPAGRTPTASEHATAEALFAEGRRLMEAGHWQDACDRFAQSLELEPAIGTLLNLALCVERAGDTGRACSLWEQARDMARDKGSLERAKFAEDRLARLGCP